VCEWRWGCSTCYLVLGFLPFLFFDDECFNIGYIVGGNLDL
jgi:hypothetical protein